MHMVRQDGPGTDPEGVPRPCARDRAAASGDLPHQRIAIPVGKAHRKEGGSARNAMPPVFRHSVVVHGCFVIPTILVGCEEHPTLRLLIQSWSLRRLHVLAYLNLTCG
jgi:hypothetical protein